MIGVSLLAGGAGYAGMLRAKRANLDEVGHRLQVHASHQQAMAALSQLALGGLDIRSLLNHATAHVATALQVKIVRVLELEPTQQNFILRAVFGADSLVVDTELVSAAADTQAGFTLVANEPVVITDRATEKRFDVPEALCAVGVASGISVTIPSQPNVYGVLTAHDTIPRQFTADDVYFIRSVANILGVAISQTRATEALKGSESRMRAVVNNAVDGIITIDERGIMESVNPAVEQLFGYSADDLIGRNVSMLMPQPYRGQHDTYIQNYVRTGKAKIIGIGREVVGQRKDGTTFPMELAVSEFRIGDRRMFAGSVRDISERRQLEREILEAAAEEQRRIGHDLHDGLCQQLTGIAFAAEVHLQKLRSRSAGEVGTVEKISQMIDDSITQARQLARGLQPVSLDATGLVSALKELAKKIEDVFRVTCLFDCEQMVLVPDNTAATHLYRIAQEAINNAIKHGKAHTLIIELVEDAGHVRLTIRDNGIGVGESPGDGKGIGLLSMAYRARMIGGTFDIRPGSRGSGTVVTCTVPLTSIGSNGIKNGETESEQQQQQQQQQEEHKATEPELEIGLSSALASPPDHPAKRSRGNTGRKQQQQRRRQETRPGRGRSSNRP